jgi:hypothetical protein
MPNGNRNLRVRGVALGRTHDHRGQPVGLFRLGWRWRNTPRQTSMLIASTLRSRTEKPGVLQDRAPAADRSRTSSASRRNSARYRAGARPRRRENARENANSDV